MTTRTWKLGNLKDGGKPVYLEDFSWDCGWYWGGGYVGNSNLHCHFDGCFLDVPDVRGHPLGNFVTPWTPKREHEGERHVMSNGCGIWENLGFFLDDPQYTPTEWWRIKDLFKQFYALLKAAKVFRYGGHCTSQGRTTGEISPDMEKAINRHIEAVIIPAIRDALDHKTMKE
jgi:hypothetical protein